MMWIFVAIGVGIVALAHTAPAPRKDQRQTVDATARLIPQLRALGLEFGTVCQNDFGSRRAVAEPGL